MTIDIVAGDLLIDGSESYPVRLVPNWDMPRMSLASFHRLATRTVKTKRAQASGGKITPASGAADYLTNLKAMPLDPLSGEVQAYAEKTLGLDKPTQLLQTFISDGTSFIHVLVERKL